MFVSHPKVQKYKENLPNMKSNNFIETLSTCLNLFLDVTSYFKNHTPANNVRDCFLSKLFLYYQDYTKITWTISITFFFQRCV